MLGLFFNPEYGRSMSFQKPQWVSTRLQSIASQTTAFFTEIQKLYVLRYKAM
jgi:hypothetical protein